jgi:hypothetical protein
VLQARQVELALGVVAAEAVGAVRRQDAVGADHLAGGLVTGDQVLAVRVEEIPIDARRTARQVGPEFARKYLVTQALRIEDFTFADGDADTQLGSVGTLACLF